MILCVEKSSITNKQMTVSVTTRRRWLVPEVVQTSAMDCGPAALKCLLEGFGIATSYGRLREACQTEVDGTSIDTLEAVAGQLGLEAEQVMLPEDHLLLAEAEALPAIVVARTPSGATHFVVVWRRNGPVVQVMDPATGRRWMSCAELREELYKHSLTIPAASWRAWAESESFLNALRRRLSDLSVTGKTAETLIEQALADASWRGLATLDAATRLVTSLVSSGGISRGRQAAHVLNSFFVRSTGFSRNHNETSIPPEGGTTNSEIIPASYWMARTAPPEVDGEDQVLMSGAVLIQTRGARGQRGAEERKGEGEATKLSPELAAALEEKPSRPGRELFGLLRADGLLSPLVLLAALAIAAGGVLVEALLFQGLLNFSSKLNLTEQRLGAVAALTVFSLALLCLELPLAAGLLRIGRRLEARLQLAFLEKIPRLGDRYFQSRLISDMAERSHSVQTLRSLPALGGQFLRLTFELALTAAGIIWLDPRGAWVAVAVAALAVALPLAMQTRLTERDLRVRSHNGALSRFYLDALLGLVAVRAHGASSSLRREHESLLVEWMRASFGLLRTAVTVEVVEAGGGLGLAAWLLSDHLARGGEAGGALLLVYWALNLPALGQEIALIAQQYPAQRNVTLRALEPLGSPEDAELVRSPGFSRNPSAIQISAEAGTTNDIEARTTNGIALRFENVSVLAGGHLILNEIDLEIEAGSHVAIVGSSGAGKSSFVGLLLGWHRAAAGRVLVEGEELSGARLARLRGETAWVDPAVQLWNRSLVDNLRYGSAEESAGPLGAVIEAADLRRVLEKLPDGWQTGLGEGGALVSGGEGQRVRLGRAMLRRDARLVILDEPFRGLDRERRRALMRRARELWSRATLLCITHDVGETLDFERALVVDGGRIAEDGDPQTLAAQPVSRYGELLSAEESIRAGLWANDEWRRLRMEGGQVVERDIQHTGSKSQRVKGVIGSVRTSFARLGAKTGVMDRSGG
jgi:ABC-type bacteriocin/lantibiotic exporter with double-glycine peptidase domain